jgi:predicted  nucleic acid-binding Zn-ribbon protein
MAYSIQSKTNMHHTLACILSVTFGVFTLMTSLYSVAEDVPEPSTIRLPGISHVWGVDTKDMSTITFEEIENCISTDATIRQQVASVQLETKHINEEVAQAETSVEENQHARLALEKEASEVQLEIAAMNTLSEQFSKRKQDLSALTSKKVDAAAAKKINQQVEQFNKDIIQFNADSSALKEKTQQLKTKQNKFNDDLESLKHQLDQLNSKTNAFNERKKSFDKTMLSYKDKCTGTHKLEK